MQLEITLLGLARTFGGGEMRSYSSYSCRVIVGSACIGANFAAEGVIRSLHDVCLILDGDKPPITQIDFTTDYRSAI